MDTSVSTATVRPRTRANRPLVVLASVAVVFLLYFGAPFFVPLFVSVLISFALSPVVDAFTKVLRLRALAAAIVVLMALSFLGIAAYSWSDDIVTVWEKVPVAAKSISKSVQRMTQKPATPMTEMKKAAAEIDSAVQGNGKAAASAQPAPAAQPPTQINVWQMIWAGGKGVGMAIGQLVVVTFLVYFMLASGSLFKRKIVILSGERLAQRKLTVEMLDEIDQQVRRYLLVVLTSNILVGVGTWLVFHFAGLQYAGLWGMGAGVLHTIPYFGSALIAVGSLLVAVVQFDDWGRALMVAGSSVVVATLVGNMFSTWLASRQTRMNTTAAFVGLLFFGWIWGLWGLLLGIPILAIVKTVCDHNEDWKPVGELLGQ